MSIQEDIRWQQRLQNYLKALLQLKEGVTLANTRQLSNIEKQGLIKAFEFTHELGWNVMKDFLEYQGTTNIMGSRDAIREVFQRGIIEQGDIWMEMIKSRNQSAHTYNEETADQIIKKIVLEYIIAFEKFSVKMQELANA